MLRERVVHRDADFLIVDKPAGMPVQGGPGVLSKRQIGLLSFTTTTSLKNLSSKVVLQCYSGTLPRVVCLSYCHAGL